MIQESVRLLNEGEMFNFDNGEVCKFQMPPVAWVYLVTPKTVIAILLPSAEEAATHQLVAGAIACVQAEPKFVEVNMATPAGMIIFDPSADIVIQPVEK